MLKCAATCLLAVLSLQAVSGAQMSDVDRAAEIARLQTMLDAHKEVLDAGSRDRRASASAPQFKTMQGNLEFQVKDGKRIGYKIGTADAVPFDTLAKTDQQLGLLIQSVHKSGEATGENTATIDYLKTNMANTIDFLKTNMSVAVFDTKLDNAVGKFDSKLTPLQTRMKTMEDKVKAMGVQAAEGAKKKETSYWLDMFVDAGEIAGTTTVGPNKPTTLSVVGVGFAERYDPEASNQLKCEFNDGKSKKTAFGSVAKEGAYYRVQCALPGYPKGATVEVALYEHTGTKIPFLGGAGSNKVKSMPMYTDTTLKSNFPKAATYTVTGAFEKGKAYKCIFRGDRGETSNTVVAQSTDTLLCGTGPTKQISSWYSEGAGKATLVIMQGSDTLAGTAAAKNIMYYTCTAGDFVADCMSGCPITNIRGQKEYTSAGTHKWTANHCGYVSVVAVGGGSGGGWQWSSGGGGGGGLGYIKKYPVVKGKQYTVVVGKSGTCQANAGNTHASDGGTSYFVSSGTVAGYGGGKGGGGSESGSAGYGGGYKGDGGGRGGRGGRGSWTGGGGGAGGYKGRGGDHNSCHHNNRNCDAQAGSGAGGGSGYYSSTHGTPGGGGVGINGFGGSGRGDWRYGGTGGSGGQSGSHGEPYSNGHGRCVRYGGRFGGGGPGSGTSHSGSGGTGGVGAVRIIWGQNRQYPAGGGNV